MPNGPLGSAAERCPSCEAPRPERFCARCGEERVRPEDYRLREVASHAADALLSVDGTLWRTVRALVTRPGLLTTEYLAGRRRGYTRPLQLFLLVNVVFFLVMGGVGTFRWPLAAYRSGRASSIVLRDTTRVAAMVTARARAQHVTPAEFARRFDAASGAQQSVWLLTVPVFALLLAALYARRRRPYVHHLVFAVHFFAFFLVVIGGMVAVMAAGTHGALWLANRHALVAWPATAHALRAAAVALDDESTWVYPLLAGIGAYLLVALHRAYPEAWWRSAARAALLVAALPWFISLYRDLLFFIAFYSA